MRYPVVLFDLDGTVVDSGGIILASMRHAAHTVLGREFSDQELLASVGGPGLEAQMAVLAEDRVDELVRVYREHNEPLHDTLEFCAGMADVLATLKARGTSARAGDGEAAGHRRARVRPAAARRPVRDRGRR